MAFNYHLEKQKLMIESHPLVFVETITFMHFSPFEPRRSCASFRITEKERTNTKQNEQDLQDSLLASK